MNSAFYESFNYWIQGGILLVPIALVGFLIFFYFLRLNERLKESLIIKPGLEDEIEDKLNRGEPLSEKLGESNGFFSGIVDYVSNGLSRGVGLAELFTEVWQQTFPPLRRDLVILAALISAAPLLGLLGTVWGMIQTFQVLALKTGGSSGLMAAGISQALITTQFGLVVALPGIFGVSRLRRKLQELEVRVTSLQMHFSLGLRNNPIYYKSD